MTTGASDLDFQTVPLDTLVRCRTSPDPDDPDFRGIALAAPGRVTFGSRTRDAFSGAFARVPVCATHCFDADHLGLDEQFAEHIVIVAVDGATHAASAAFLPGDEDPPSGPGGSLDLKDGLGSASITGYFNVNIADLLHLPAREADYHVYAFLGEHVSNVVHIEVRREDAEERKAKTRTGGSGR